MIDCEPSIEDEVCGKAAQIVISARDAFLEQGYDAVSMDSVAKRACVAKQTVYAHFASKEALFLAVVKGEQRRMRIALPDMPEGGRESIRDTLLTIGQRYLDNVLAPTVLSLLRLAIAEANRFPALGRSIREAGPKQTAVDLAQILARGARGGKLAMTDPAQAAAHFIALTLGALHIHCLLDPTFSPSPAEVRAQVEAAVDCFLGRYGVQQRETIP